MAKVEIEESELAAYRRIQGVAETLLQNPKTRTQFLKLQKEIHPEAVIPELDAAEGVLQAVRGIEEKVTGVMTRLDERENAAADAERTREIEGRMRTGQKMLRDEGYNADGIDKIEKLMLEEGISNYSAGLALFERRNPPSAPADASTSRWGSMSDQNMDGPDVKDLWDTQGQSEKWVQDSIASIRKEFRQ